ncbi:phage antirepressor N-terminal domain-containing protein, partial [Priestia sp. JV24]
MRPIVLTERKTVNFMGAELLAAKANDEKIYVGVGWVCNGIGFNKAQKDRQVQNIQDDLVLKQGCFKFEAGVFDPHNEVLAIELDFLPLWLAKISITPAMQKETPWLARALVEYQLKVKDVLVEAFLSKPPQSIEDLIIMQAQSMKEIRENQEKFIQNQLQQEKKLEVV